MAWTTTRTRKTTIGNLRLEIGTWTATGVTGGDIVTTLSEIEHFSFANHTGNRADSSIDTASTAGTATIAGVTASDTGTYAAFGRGN